MKKYLAWLITLFPMMAFADNSLSFAPPPSDYSIVFLGNLFGIVDGVINGTGSQIMGSMFAVFNSAVLALGGIIITYTLLVSTLNTAHEGQMMGQKWNSIWVPLRSTIGLALLIPKASGYCMMQIFIMWVVVQGVGAADKVWNAALDYLNRGGVIIQAQMSPSASLMGAKGEVAEGAGTILNGQVCMLGIQNTLQTQRDMYLKSKDNNAGPCFGKSDIPGMDAFCSTAVPDFISSVNMVAVQNSPENKGKSGFSVGMPNFDANSPYAALNGVCGTVAWKAPEMSSVTQSQSALQKQLEFVSPGSSSQLSGISNDSLETAKLSRAIAIQQMYVDLSAVAQVMVNNNPALNTNNAGQSQTQNTFAPFATSQFGIPLNVAGAPCDNPLNGACISWGTDTSANAASGNSSAALFSGSEFQGAIADYNGVMKPTLQMMANAAKSTQTLQATQFINDAKNQGWMMAGSYFFQLAQINNNNTNPNSQDSNTGLGESIFDLSGLTDMFDSNGGCAKTYKQLCFWLNSDEKPMSKLASMFNGADSGVAPPIYGNLTNVRRVSGVDGSTVYGFINNSMMVTLPGQPGQNPPQFNMNINIRFQAGPSMLPRISFGCGFTILGVCVGGPLGDMLYNGILRGILDFIMTLMQQVVNALIMAVLYIPLQGMAQIFKDAVSIIQQPSANPLIALANMGATYINFANEMWINILTTSLLSMVLGPFGIIVFSILMLVMPILLAWLSVMLSIGFIAAYYVPFLPYMLFTFGSIAWFTSVIEAMVAGPIVALGVTHPEGHDAFGKGDQAIMILLNVFLRPAMMIIGYIAAIAMTYVSVWIINAGFANAMSFISGPGADSQWNDSSAAAIAQGNIGKNVAGAFTQTAQAAANNTKGYSNWASVYAFFFSVLIYTTMYLIVVQKAFSLITYLPDKVLRWIGGQPESMGQEATQWGDEAKQQVGKGEEATSKGASQMDGQLATYGAKGIKGAKDMMGGSTSMGGSETPSSTPSPPE